MKDGYKQSREDQTLLIKHSEYQEAQVDEIIVTGDDDEEEKLEF